MSEAGDTPPGKVTAAEPSLQQAKALLTRLGLQDHDGDGLWTPLTGGVSSELWRVDLPSQTVCVKGALSQLRVADDWRAPLSRNASEFAWLQFAAAHRPANVPRPLAHDQSLGLFVMEYLRPETHPNWKAELLAGRVSPAFAGQVGDVVGTLHAVSARDTEVPDRFATDATFAALRIDPYFRVTASRSPVVRDRLLQLAGRTAGSHRALVHGDVSPKNILVGPDGPVLLDAECAWFGDPAFDVAFCLTHLALKMVVRPDHAAELRRAAHALVEAHGAHLDWENPDGHAERVATLLPALLLARVDGASPVEYLDPGQQHLVRTTATRLLQAPADDPLDVMAAWGVLTR